MSSLRTRSVAGRGARIIVGLRLTSFRSSFTAAALALCPRSGTLLARGNAQPFHAPRIGIKHFDLVTAGAGNHLASHRQPADMGHEIAPECLDLFAGLTSDEILADHGANVIEPGTGVRDKGIVSLPNNGGRFIAVVLVIDLANDLLDDILDRD